jgi:hypothetical protein
MGGFPLPSPGSIPTGSVPISTLGATRRNLENNVANVEAAAEQLSERLPNTEKQAAAVADNRSAARLDDLGFQNRVTQHEVGNFDPENGLLFRSNLALMGNTSISDVMQALESPPANPLDSPLLRDHSLVTGTQVEAGYQFQNWRVGARVDASAAVATEGVTDNVRDLRQLQSESKKLEAQMTLIQRQVTRIQNNLDQSPEFQRMNTLLESAARNPAGFSSADRSELNTLLQSDNVQALFTDLNQVLDQSQRLMGAASDTLGLIGDGTRRLHADVQVRGAAEVFLGYRSDAIALGENWQMDMGAEVAGILPIPTGNTELIDGYPAFRTAMHKAATEVNITVSGLEQLQNRLGSIETGLSTLQDSVTQAQEAGESVQDAATATTPRDQARATLNAVRQGNAAVTGLNRAGQSLNNDLSHLAQDLNNLDVEVTATLRTVEANPGMGVGLRDVSLRMQGQLDEHLRLELMTGASNAVGYLSGTERAYNVAIDILIDDQQLKLNLRDETRRNVFHDFYSPTLYQSIHLEGRSGDYRFQVQGRTEMSLDDPDKIRAGAMLRQGSGPLEILTGISNADVFGSDSQTQYQLGVSYANVGSVYVETDGFVSPSLLNVHVAVNVDRQFHVHGGLMLSSSEQGTGTAYDYAGVLGFGGTFFPPDED